jgi:hypothetical protein
VANVAKRYLMGPHPPQPRRSEKGAQLRLLRQRPVVMTAQKAQADVLLYRLHYALPGWDAAADGARGAMRKTSSLHSAAQARAWADGDFDADHGLGLDGVGRSAYWSRARGPSGVDAAAVRAPLLCISPLRQTPTALPALRMTWPK